MEYTEAMEKAVGGFRDIHSARILNEKSWDQVYSDFMNVHGLPL